MKNKIIIAIAIALFSASASYAAPIIKVGIKAGINAQSANFSSPELTNYSLSTKSKIGGQFGAFARINLLMFHVQPELMYSMNRFMLKATPKSQLSSGPSESTVKQNSLDVPVLFGFKFLIFRVNAGPVFNIMNEGSTKMHDDIKHSVHYTKSSVSYAVGLGLDLDKVSLDVRYNGQFKESTQSIKIGDSDVADFKTPYGNWAFTVGYSF